MKFSPIEKEKKINSMVEKNIVSVDNEIMNLVEVMNDEVVVSSRQVAEHFGKQHFHVMRDIDTILDSFSENPNLDFQKNFHKTEYKVEGNNKTYSMYLMNKDGFSLLAMGFSGKKALNWKVKYIEAFNYMEEMLKNQLANKVPSYQINDEVERTKRWIEEAQERLLLAQKNERLETKNKELSDALEEAEPKIHYCDIVFASKETVSVSVIAKDYGMTAQEMNELLKENKIQYKRGKCWYIYNKYAANNYIKYETIVRQNSNNEDFTITHMKWTHKGRIFVYNFLKDNFGILPLIERE